MSFKAYKQAWTQLIHDSWLTYDYRKIGAMTLFLPSLLHQTNCILNLDKCGIVLGKRNLCY